MQQATREPQARDVSLRTGLRMRFYQWGEKGPAMLLLHPSSGFGRHWDFVVRQLPPDLRVIAPDQRGHGDSSTPDGSYTGEEFAEDAGALIEELGLDQVIIGGHSLGGRVATIFAGMHPERVKALMLVGGPHYDSYFQEARFVDRRLRVAERMHGSARVFATREEAYLWLKGVFPNDPQPALPEEILQHSLTHNFRQLPQGGWTVKYDQLRVAQGLVHIPDDLKRYAQGIACPVAFIPGKRGIHLSREQAQKVALCFSKTKVRTYEVEGDYALQLENPTGLAKAIQQFLRDIGVGHAVALGRQPE